MQRKSLPAGIGIVALFSVAALGATENHAPVVSNVSASQRGDGSNIVDIYYDLADADGDSCTVFVLLSNNAGETWGIQAFAISGDMGAGVRSGTRKHVVWDVGTDAPGLVGDQFKARVIADDSHRQQGAMCLVEAGRFRTSTGVWVQLDSYLIDKYEVTNYLYCLFLNAGGNDDHYHSGEIERNGDPGSYTYRPKAGYEQRPAGCVSWFDAVGYCDWRSASEGVPAGTYHLPTEAQWEKAAGWDPAWEELSGYAIHSDSISCAKANYNNCVGHSTDVGSYPYTSWYGCYDMSGNVWEWCSDWYQSSYPSSTSNPTGPATGSTRVHRGGGWDYDGSSLRVSCRYGGSPSYWCSYGFRCARTSE